MQHGPHPAPIFAPKLAVAPVPMPRAFVPQAQPLAPQQAVAAVPSPAPRPHAVTEPRRNDPIAQLLAPSDHVLAVQRVLTEYGYGPVRPTGVAGPETREAIKKFERARKMPVTGEISDRLVEALTQLSGRPLN
jgi:peptidoglycan hydrolase-like protein with peptidoglycan-binding domain